MNSLRLKLTDDQSFQKRRSFLLLVFITERVSKNLPIIYVKSSYLRNKSSFVKMIKELRIMKSN